MSKPEAKLFELLPEIEVVEGLKATTHVYHGGANCETDTIGFSSPKNRSPLDLVVDASNGFIPLWHKGTVLRWRFQEQSLLYFTHPERIKDYVRNLFGESLLAWGDSVPVRFAESTDLWDFEISVRSDDNCSPAGCTLARAFFPDAGQHELVLFPKMFGQEHKEQIETMAHELGHVFGLRHFFAEVSEKAFPSKIFGTHNKVSIMNYGANSRLTSTDISDLSELYRLAWTGDLTEINETPVRLMRPFSYLNAASEHVELIASIFQQKRAIG